MSEWALTVKELKNLLSEFDDDLEVYTPCQESYWDDWPIMSVRYCKHSNTVILDVEQGGVIGA